MRDSVELSIQVTNLERELSVTRDNLAAARLVGNQANIDRWSFETTMLGRMLEAERQELDELLVEED